MEEINIKPMEEWLYDRICLIEAILNLQLHRGKQMDEALVAERNLLQTMLDFMEG